MTAARQRGFTLVELMTVVVIIGILAAIAIPNLRNTADCESTARNIASMIGEAARTAVGRGPVPAEVIATSVAPERVRITISGSDPQAFEVRLQVETSETTSEWFTINQTRLPRGITVEGYSNTADLDGGDTVTAAGVSMGCFSNGKCDPKTIYLHRTDNRTDKFRVVVMPLSTAPQVLRGW